MIRAKGPHPMFHDSGMQARLTQPRLVREDGLTAYRLDGHALPNTFVVDPIAVRVDQELRGHYTDILRIMWLIRHFESVARKRNLEGRLSGATHFSEGEEAVPTAVCAVLGAEDDITSTHRGHGHCLARSLWRARSPEAVQEVCNRTAAELLGKDTGYCRGRGGSMHIADVESGNLGATGIVAGNVPVAVGAGLAHRYLADGGIVVCFHGDGATNNGAWHESLNAAATLLDGLPVVFVLINNGFGMSVPFNRASVSDAPRAANVSDAVVRAIGYGMAGILVDGMDPLAVEYAAGIAADTARQLSMPVLIEAQATRLHGHTMSDQQTYRTKEEKARWAEADPLVSFPQRLVDSGTASQKQVDDVRDEALEVITRAFEFADESPYPDFEEYMRSVYVPLDPGADEQGRQDEAILKPRVREIEDAVRLQMREGLDLTTPEGEVRAAMVTVGAGRAKELQERFGMPVLPYSQAVADAMGREMERDGTVYLLGEDVGMYGGAYAASRGLYHRFGPRRVIDSPISESMIAGAAVGAALKGLRPVHEFQYGDFMTQASDQIIHNAAYTVSMFARKTGLPLVYRSQGGLGRCLGQHHSESLEYMFINIPGIYLVMPATPYDAKGLLTAAIRDDNPVIFLEHKLLYSGTWGPVPADDYVVPLGLADIKRPGRDVTIVTYSRMTHFALEAALRLAGEGIEAEVVDVRSLKPLDAATCAESVRKTGKLVTLTEGYGPCGVAEYLESETVHYRFEDGASGFDYLDAEPVQLSCAPAPIGRAETLEAGAIPLPSDIARACRSLVRGTAG